MKKGSGTKNRITITLDKSLLDELNSTCQENFMKISPFVEHLIKKGLEEYKKKK